jgi:hypothetical protein
MTIAVTRDTSGPVDASIEAPRVVRQRRIRPGLLGVAVLLIALGGLGAAFAVMSVRSTGSYLAVVRPVPVGSTLFPEDLTTVEVAGGQGIRPIPAARRESVMGLRAAVTLVPGTLLTDAQLTREPPLGPGQQQIGLGLKPSQIPARHLNPGDKVQVVGTPPKDDTGQAAVTRYDATVIDTLAQDRSNAVLYLAVQARDAAAIVLLAGADRVAVVLNPAA